MGALRGHGAVVTSGSRGIGAEFCRFTAEGAAVVFVYYSDVHACGRGTRPGPANAGDELGQSPQTSPIRMGRTDCSRSQTPS